MRPIPIDEAARLTVRARYGAGTLDGKPAPGYLKEKGVAPNSKTETFVALKTLRRQLAMVGRRRSTCATGKRLPRRASTVIAVQFQACAQDSVQPQRHIYPRMCLMIRIQPDEGFSFDVMAKRPGLGPAR